MKTKIKRHSRSIVSVLLSVCMLISCMTVGLIATDAARISDDETVGYDSSSDKIHIKIGTASWTDYYFSSGGETSFTVASDNTTVEFIYYVSGKWYKWDSSQGNYSAGSMHKTSGCERLAMTKGSNNYKVTGVYADTYTVNITQAPSNGEMKVKIKGTGDGGGGGVDVSTGNWYLYGHQFGGWTASTSASTSFDGYDSDGGYRYKTHTVASDSDYFRIYGASSGGTNAHYNPSTNADAVLALGDESTTGVTVGTGENGAFQLYDSGKTSSLAPGTEVKICFNGSKVWVESAKQPVVSSLVLTATKYSLTDVNETTNFIARAEGLQTGVTNLTYKLFKADGTQVGSDVTVTDGSLTATFANVAPNVNMQGYYATVEETSGTTYKSVTSNETTVTNSNEAYKPDYLITFTSDVNGTVAAYDDEGNALTSGTSRIKEGRHVTFKATPASTSYRFKNWTGVAVTSGLLTDEGKTKSAVTLTVYSDITLQANFEAKGYAINAGDTTNHNMKELSNGWYISTSTYGAGAYFKIRRLSDSKVTKPSDTSAENNGCSITNREIKKDVASWEDETNWDYHYAFHADTGEYSYYVVYDPKNDQVWLSYHEDAQYKIKVIAKDGTVRKDHATTTTSSFGDTKITVLSNPEGTTIKPEDDQLYNSVYQAEKVELSAAQARQGVKLKIRTDVDQTNHSGYFVKGFDVNGGETQGVISQEFNADGTEKSSYTDKAKIDGGYNEFTIDIQGYEDSVIEITPIYYKKETVKGDNIRFIVDGFDGTVKENWDGNLACYAYGSNDSEPFGYYPGQPMVCIGGRYMAELPRNNSQTTGITLNNYVWDYTHAYYHLNNDTSDNNIKAHNRQTYDYNEFKIINKIFSNMDEWPDEDIIFSFKYKETQAIADSNLGTAVYYTDSASDKQNTTYDYRTVANTINPANYTFENLTNFYGERVDLRGNLVDVDSNTHRYENPLLVISNGYDWNSVGKFATAWAIYEPANSTGNPGTYTLKEVIGGQGAIKSGTTDIRKNGSQSYLIDPDAEQMDEKYGWDTENSHFVVTLNNRPAMICYEYEVKSAYSNEEVNSGSDPLSNDGNPGYRSDGRWYYSNSTQMIKSHVLIEYRESGLDTYTRDYYQRDNIDYTVDGYDRTKNQGLSTGIRAYYSNSGTVSNTTSSYTNTLGCTEAAAITDGEMTFDLTTTPDLDGNYTFEGWYLLENGKYTFVSDEYEYSAEALTNDVFVARYVKAPSGIVNITHALTTDSTGKAPTKLQVSVVDANNTDDVKFAFEETTGGQIVNSTYIKYDASSPKALKITLTNTPDKYSVFETFKENVTGTLANLNGSTYPSIATGATITNGPNNTCVIIIPINNLFSNEGEHDQITKALPFFSKVDLIHRHYKVEFEYKSRKTDLKDDNSRMWGTQSYSVEGAITDSDYNSGYFDLTDDAYKKAVLSTKKAEFLAKICPYEENFKENITWDFNDASKISSPTYSREDKVSYKVTANYSDDNIISYKFRFPFAYTGPTTTDGVITFTPTETTITVDGKEVTDAVMYIDPSAEEQSLEFEPQLIYSGENRPAAGKLIYQDWVSLNSIHNSAEAATAVENNDAVKEPVFVTAPEKLYKAVTENGVTTYKEMQFKYWSIRPYENSGTEAEVYKKCYYKEFNFALYQDAEITAEYEEVPEKSEEPEEPEESGEPERITTYISHDQNSRTQWNDNYGTANTAYSNYTAADRIFVDFMVNYEYKGQTLKELTVGNNPDNVRVGVILVRTDELDTDDVKTNAQYKAEYETGDNIALHSAEADGYITKIMNGTAFTSAEDTVCNKSGASVNVTALDNKNMMDYAYSYANISQSTRKPTEHKNYLYRAYSYLIYQTTDNDVTTNHFVKSAPEYFTFYDIASISGEEIVRNS